MTPWDIPPHRLATVAPVRKPPRPAVFWGDVTAVSLFLGGVIGILVWWLA